MWMVRIWVNTWDEAACTIGGQDCFGLYKIQRGYDGFVEHRVEPRKMFPYSPMPETWGSVVTNMSGRRRAPAMSSKSYLRTSGRYTT